MLSVNEDLDSLSSAWRDAAADLGVEVTAPFNIADAQCIAWVEHFGSSRGTVVVGRRTSGLAIRAAANSQAMFYSEVDEAEYGQYDRDIFVATLNDWGWHGDPSVTPEWYTGEPWG